ncbi:MAG: hypothetical protein ACT4TC_18155 [Myxococcaceae bacterium]
MSRLHGDEKLGFFAGNADDLFAESPAALELIHTVRTMRIVGLTMYSVGLAVLVTDLVAIVVWGINNASTATSFPMALFTGGLVVGGVLGLVGGALLQIASVNVFEAMNRYNSDILNQQLPPSERLPPPDMFSQRTPPPGPTLPLLQFGF